MISELRVGSKMQSGEVQRRTKNESNLRSKTRKTGVKPRVSTIPLRTQNPREPNPSDKIPSDDIMWEPRIAKS